MRHCCCNAVVQEDFRHGLFAKVMLKRYTLTHREVGTDVRAVKRCVLGFRGLPMRVVLLCTIHYDQQMFGILTCEAYPPTSYRETTLVRCRTCDLHEG